MKRVRIRGVLHIFDLLIDPAFISNFFKLILIALQLVRTLKRVPLDAARVEPIAERNQFLYGLS